MRTIRLRRTHSAFLSPTPTVLSSLPLPRLRPLPYAARSTRVFMSSRYHEDMMISVSQHEHVVAKGLLNLRLSHFLTCEIFVKYL